MDTPAKDQDTLIDRIPELGERWGCYVLDDRIASGGMADVFRARRVGAESFSRLVCIKRMHAHLGLQPDMVELFLDEARIGSKLRHRNIVAVDDLGVHDGRYYLAMEYVHGADLRTLMKRANESGRLVPVEAAAYVANEILAALHAAHTAIDPETHRPLRIVHRDVSPQNVLVAFSGQVKLADFGVARAEGRRRVTEGRAICGKIGYMPLEQASGGTVDHRADLFALGVTIFELLTGHRPFATQHTRPTREQILAAMMNEQRPRLRDLRPDVTPAFESLVDAMLVVAPQRRLPSAYAGLQLLDRIPERLRGGTALIEWIGALFPGQSSVASIARASLPFPPTIPTPRVHPDHVPAAPLVQRPAAPEQPACDATRQIRRRAHVMLADGPIASAPAGRSSAPPHATTALVPRTRPPASRTHNALALAIALTSCAITLALFAHSLVSSAQPRANRLPFANANMLASLAAASAPTIAPPVAIEPAPPLATTPVVPASPIATARSSHGRRVRHAESPVVHAFPAIIPLVATPHESPPAMGSLRVVVLPWGDVEVDGEARGRAPVVVALTAGSHRVRVTGAINRSERVEITEGHTAVLHVEEP